MEALPQHAIFCASADKNPALNRRVTRGYTGQENMPAACAVNLNARLYDPTIARMMSADPTIPNPMDGQSFNRFSYVANNPLALTDPTGYVTDPPNPNIVNDLGAPCWGCSGAGTETSDSSGLPVDASGHPDCYSCGVQIVATAPDGSEYVATYNKATGEFQSLTQVANNTQTGNNMPVSAPALSDQFSGGSSSAPAGSTAGSGSYSPPELLPSSGVSCSPGAPCGDVAEVPGDTNGGYLNAGLLLGDHDYNTANMICAAASRCSASLVGSVYSQQSNGIPGSTSSAPIVSGNTYPVYVEGVYIGDVQSYVGKDGLTVDNVTDTNHVLFDGYISRNAIQVDGAWYSVTHGTGTSYYGGAFVATGNQVFGPALFNAMDASIASQLYAATHH